MTAAQQTGGLPDRGVTVMALIVEASERMDAGEADAMDRALERIKIIRERFRQGRSLERDPGEEG